MSRLTRDGTAEPVSLDQILRRERGLGNINFPCSADHEQDWQPYPVDPYSCYSCQKNSVLICFFNLAENNTITRRRQTLVRSPSALLLGVCAITECLLLDCDVTTSFTTPRLETPPISETHFAIVPSPPLLPSFTSCVAEPRGHEAGVGAKRSQETDGRGAARPGSVLLHQDNLETWHR